MNMILAAAMIYATMATNANVNPLDAYVAWSRNELKSAGLTRKTTDDGSVYWTGGAEKGKTLVLLHGVNDQAGTWAQVVPLLKNDYRLIVPDLAGHGESEPKAGPISYDVILQRLQTILERESAGKATLAGNSMGGWIAMLYTLQHPDKVERLVLEDSSGMAWDMTGVPLAPKNREEAAAMMRAVHGPDVKTSGELLDAIVTRKDPPLSRFALTDVMQHFVDARLGQIKVPVSLIWGHDDAILPLAYAKKLHERIPGSTLTIIEGAAHIPHRQQPARFVQCLKATC